MTDRREDSPGPGHFRGVQGLRIVLVLDLVGVLATGVVAAVIGSRATAGSLAALDGALVGTCALAAGATWLLAVVAVARFGGGRMRHVRMLLVAGLVLNGVGNLAIAVGAGRSAATVAGLALAVGGTAASVAYLSLTRTASPPRLPRHPRHPKHPRHR